MSKIYFSRSISRTMSADHPVGDPTGGAAYGEKNDPISAIISIASMAGTYAAAGTFTAMTLMQGLTFAGAAMSLVGNVTGNKTLSKIGMVAGVAGGLGQMGAFGETAKSATFGSTFGNSASSGSGTAAGAMASKSGSLKYTPSGDMADEMAAQQKIVDANKAAGMKTSGTAGQNANSYAGNNLQPSANAPAGANAPASPSPEYLKDFKPADYSASSITTGNSVGLTTNPPPAGTPQLNVPNEPGVWDNLKQGNYWEATKQAGSAINPVTNPYGAMAVGQIAAPISEYLSGKTDAEIAELEARTRANEANAGYTDERTLQLKEEIAREKMRRANLNAGYGQIDAGITINPNAYTAQQGLIAQQMQQA